MNTAEEIEENNVLDEYGHLPFKRANNRFAKYRNAQVFVIDDEGHEHELSEYEKAVKETD